MLVIVQQQPTTSALHRAQNPDKIPWTWDRILAAQTVNSVERFAHMLSDSKQKFEKPFQFPWDEPTTEIEVIKSTAGAIPLADMKAWAESQ